MQANSDPNCVFCRILAGELPCAKLLETDEALAFLDIGPLAKGHVLLIPKTHAVKLEDLSASQAGAMLRHLPALCRAVRQVTGCEGYNVLQNNGRVAHQEVMHVHFHIIPRHAGDDFAFNWPAGKYDQGELEKLQQAMRTAMEG